MTIDEILESMRRAPTFKNDPKNQPFTISSLLRAVQTFVEHPGTTDELIETGTYEIHTENSPNEQMFGMYVDPEDKVLHLRFIGPEFPPSPEQLLTALMKDFAQHMAEKEAREATKQ